MRNRLSQFLVVAAAAAAADPKLAAETGESDRQVLGSTSDPETARDAATKAEAAGLPEVQVRVFDGTYEVSCGTKEAGAAAESLRAIAGVPARVPAPRKPARTAAAKRAAAKRAATNAAAAKRSSKTVKTRGHSFDGADGDDGRGRRARPETPST